MTASACAAVGYDVLFADPSKDDPSGDQTLEAMAAGGAGRFVFTSTRLHPDYDEGSTLRASQAPAAFALTPAPTDDPKVALLLPYGEAMARFSAVANVTRNEDGVLRDILLREAVGDWALPSLPLRLAMTAASVPPDTLAPTVRPNWRAGHAAAADQRRGSAGRQPRQSAATQRPRGPRCRTAWLWSATRHPVSTTPSPRRSIR